MPIYQYQTIPTAEQPEILGFEITQSMKDVPLSQHPETGQPVRRVISGGFQPMGLRSRSPVKAPVAPMSCNHHGGPCCG
jgi:hypothetical protein